MFEIRTEAQRDWVEQKIEEFLPKVKDGTPEDNPNVIQLLTWSYLLADYDDLHYPHLSEDKYLAKAICAKAVEKNLTKLDLCNLLEVSPAYLELLISGETLPSWSTANLISTNLQIDLELLYESVPELKIVKAWTDDKDVWIECANGTKHSRAINHFPFLVKLTPKQRADMGVDSDGTALWWEDQMDGIHICSFFENPDSFLKFR